MATQGNQRATVFARLTYGIAALQPDPQRPAGWTLLVNGVPQSYVDLSDPAHQPFEYVRRLMSVVLACTAASVPPKVLHLGGGALALPRWLSRARPGSRQTVVELDPLLLAAVHRALPWPEEISVVIGDAREFTDAAEPAGYDVVVADVFQGATMPASVAGTGFAAAAAKALRPGGILVMNVTDVPPLSHSRIQAATLRSAFGEVAMIASPGMLKGRRRDNVILAAAAKSGELPVLKLSEALARDGDPARVWHGDELTAFPGGARARLDENP